MIRNYRIKDNLAISIDKAIFDLVDASLMESTFISAIRQANLRFLTYMGDFEIHFEFMNINLYEYKFDVTNETEYLYLDQIGFHFEELETSNDAFNPDFDGFEESSILFWFRENSYVKVGAQNSTASVVALDPHKTNSSC